MFSVRRSDPERVLFVHASDDARSAVYFGAALKAGSNSSFLLQSVREEESNDLDPSRFGFVVLSDTLSLPAIFEHTLAQYVQKGGNVFIALGTHAGRHARIPVWDASVTDVHNYARSAEAATVGQVDFTHPALLNQQPGRDNGGWAETKVFYAADADAGGAQVVARLSDGTPFVLDKQMGQGHLLLLASGLENLTNDLPLHPGVRGVRRPRSPVSFGQRGSVADRGLLTPMFNCAPAASPRSGKRRSDWSGWTQTAVAE